MGQLRFIADIVLTMGRSRYIYKPQQTGWVAIQDMFRKVLEITDCTGGGAQETFERRCRELEAEGWTLEPRFSDSRFMNRAGERRSIGVYPQDIRQDHSNGPGMWGMTKKTW